MAVPEAKPLKLAVATGTWADAGCAATRPIAPTMAAVTPEATALDHVLRTAVDAPTPPPSFSFVTPNPYRPEPSGPFGYPRPSVKLCSPFSLDNARRAETTSLSG